MLTHSVLIIGIVMIISGLALAFMQRPASSVVTILLLGVVLCLVGFPNLQNFAFKIFGQEATVSMAELKSGANDNLAQVAANNQKIFALEGSIQKQVALNNDMNARLSQLEQKLSISVDKPLQTNVSQALPAVATNSQYSVLVFYKDGRGNDAMHLKQKLVEQGFQSASINTSLSETTVGPQPDNSEYIVYTAKGAAILDAITAIIKMELKGPGNAVVGQQGPDTLRRGDAQIFLF